MEFVSPCLIVAFDVTVELWRARRQDVETRVALGTGGFELGDELGAAVDLNGFQGIGHLLEIFFEKVGDVLGGGAAIRLGDGPFGEGVVSVEVLDGVADGRGDRLSACRT